VQRMLLGMSPHIFLRLCMQKHRTMASPDLSVLRKQIEDAKLPKLTHCAVENGVLSVAAEVPVNLGSGAKRHRLILNFVFSDFNMIVSDFAESAKLERVSLAGAETVEALSFANGCCNRLECSRLRSRTDLSLHRLAGCKFVRAKTSRDTQGDQYRDQLSGNDDELVEFYDDDKALERKVKWLAKHIKRAKHFVCYTGAGISTAAKIPDFRGPNGVWTRRDRDQVIVHSLVTWRRLHV
jgi:hypothetical protein